MLEPKDLVDGNEYTLLYDNKLFRGIYQQKDDALYYYFLSSEDNSTWRFKQEKMEYLALFKDNQSGKKFDSGKNRLDLLPFKALQKVGNVMTFGAKKYGDSNWRSVQGWEWRYFGAAMRHLFAWKLGEKTDPETGESHLAHAAACILFMLELE